MRHFKSPQRHQLMLFPPNLNDWISEDHPARFIVDFVDTLDLSEIYQSYGIDGAPPYHPAMMLSILLYGSMRGIHSSRKLECAVIDDIGLRWITGGLRPDHDTIANFRKTYRNVIQLAFVESIKLANRAGAIGLRHVAIDGTKLMANASRGARLSDTELDAEIEKEVAKLLGAAEELDSREDKDIGKGQNGYQLPEHLKDNEARKKWIAQELEALKKKAATFSILDGLDCNNCTCSVDAKVVKGETAAASDESRGNDASHSSNESTIVESNDNEFPVSSDESTLVESNENQDSAVSDEHAFVESTENEEPNSSDEQVTVVETNEKQDSVFSGELEPISTPVSIETLNADVTPANSPTTHEQSEESEPNTRLKGLKRLEVLNKAQAVLIENELARKAADPTGKRERDGNRKRGGKPFVPKINVTDPSARKMKFKNGLFADAYNGQIAVDDRYGIIIAASVTQDENDLRQLKPVLSQASKNVGLPRNASGDTGYFNIEHIEDPLFAGVNFFVPPRKPAKKEGPNTKSQLMRNKLETSKGKAIYAMRKAIVEPVFGAIKHARAFRRVAMRGMEMVETEWYTICTTHNLLKLYTQWAGC